MRATSAETRRPAAMRRRPSGLGLTTRDHELRTHGWFDQVVAAALILLTLPVLLFVALLILSVCGRPILTTRSRIGRRGENVSVVNFDTTRFDRTRSHFAANVLHLIRKSGLDELPQLFKVAKGEASFSLPPLDD